MRTWPLLAHVFLCAPTVARAEPTEVVALTYRAPGACPDEHAFVTAVQLRTARASFAEGGARHFSVLLEKRADGFHGRLSVGDGMRDLASPRCEDLFDAFVLFVAIAIDPDGSPPPDVTPEEPAPPPPPPLPPPVPRHRSRSGAFLRCFPTRTRASSHWAESRVSRSWK